MREETEFRPKPMVEVGGRPVLWHIMTILARQGITEFIVCVGYRGDVIRDYFLNFAARFADFTVMTDSPNSLEIHSPESLPNWKITIAETGGLTMTGERIRRIAQYVSGERFLVTYGDGLANVYLKDLIFSHQQSGCTATLTSTRPHSRFGVLDIDSKSKVRKFSEKPIGSDLVNIGYFIFEPEIFNFLGENSVLENEPLASLARNSQLNSYEHKGFWQPMDTQKEADHLRELWESGPAPWFDISDSNSSKP